MIVHVSNDFPDSVNPAKTHAVKNLLDMTANAFDHFVYSLNRRSPGLAHFIREVVRQPRSPNLPIFAMADTPQIIPVCYSAPGRGVYLHSQLERVADWISNDIERRALRPQIIHGHKLTMEGIVASKVAARLGIPFAISIRGNTDSKILAARPDLKSHYRQVFQSAAVAFFFAPWVQREIEARLGKRSGPTETIAVATNADRIIAPKIVGPRLITAFHLDHHRNKNVRSLIRAAAVLGKQVEGADLSIIGGGSPEAKRTIEAQIERYASPARLEGPIVHDAIQSRMNSAGGFVLVSQRESFGMVFIEAILAGCPVVFPKGRAIEGYFDGCAFAIPASPGDQPTIIDAMRKLTTDETRLKAHLGEWQQGPGPRHFQRAAIAETYVTAMKRAIAQGADDARA
jgi:glycosyltransferase involved in cell wall biosynthesis